jgi:hypothetical protein
MGAPKMEEFGPKKSDKPKPQKQAPAKSKKMSSGERGDRAMRTEFRKLRMKLKRSEHGRSRRNRPTNGILARMSEIKKLVPSLRDYQPKN